MLPIIIPIVPTGEIPLYAMLQRQWMPSGTDGSDPTRYYPSREELHKDLYMQSTVSPYEGLAIVDTSRPFFGGQSNAYQARSIILDKIRTELQGEPARLVIEVGSFIGSGAVGVWGPLAKADGGLCICIDTWLGDLSMRLIEGYSAAMRHVHGFPTLKDIFLQRMLFEGMQDTVYPLQMPGTSGARTLFLLGYKADVIYVDSAHERFETLAELHLFWQILRPGGLMLGDDFHGFEAVAHDVRVFATCYNLTIDAFYGEQWLIRKPIA